MPPWIFIKVKMLTFLVFSLVIIFIYHVLHNYLQDFAPSFSAISLLKILLFKLLIIFGCFAEQAPDSKSGDALCARTGYLAVSVPNQSTLSFQEVLRQS